MTNSLVELSKVGQSLWLDYIKRSLLDSGELHKLVVNDKLKGVTSNPSIFEKAIDGSNEYDDEIKKFANKENISAKEIFEHLAVADIQKAADILQPIYEESNCSDGYVSLEVSPHLANDTQATILEAKRLWQIVDRKNLMIKVPGNESGIPAIEELIACGINVNVTLLFSMEYYKRAAFAFIEGLEQRVKKNKSVKNICSVASFFISRIDTAVDNLLDEKISNNPDNAHYYDGMRGKIAIANAKLTYQEFKHIFTSERWHDLQQKGALPQRVLWASTSTKNPAYSDVVYVEELIGANTVNTVPPVTMDKFRDHGSVSLTLEKDVAAANNTMHHLGETGISFDKVTDTLLQEGLNSFSASFDKLLKTIEEKCNSFK